MERIREQEGDRSWLEELDKLELDGTDGKDQNKGTSERKTERGDVQIW